MSRAAAALVDTAVWGIATQPKVVVDAMGRKFVHQPLLDRFMSNVRLDGECWIWTKTLVTKGYAPFYISQRTAVAAHRWIYTLFRAEVPEGLQLDHLCRRRSCVNSWHLEPVDNRENQRRGEQLFAGVTYRTDRCWHDHSMADAYVFTNSRTGRSQRRCRPCRDAYVKAHPWKKKAA